MGLRIHGAAGFRLEDTAHDSGLTAGYVLPYSCGINNPALSGTSIYGTTEGTGYHPGGSNGSTGLSVGRIEIFTIGPAESTPAVPEPGALTLFLPALAVVAFARRKKSS